MVLFETEVRYYEAAVRSQIKHRVQHRVQHPNITTEISPSFETATEQQRTIVQIQTQ